MHDERAGYTDTTVYRAPLVQDALAARFVPANGGYSASDPRSQILLFGQIMLPYFPEISIADLVKVAKNETEAFTRFTYRLRQMLAEVPAADSRQALQRIVEEIKYHEAGLQLEAKKVGRAKFLAGSGLACFSVCLSTLIFNDNELLKQVAGFLGSAALIDNVRNLVEIGNAKLAMKSNDFYVPYLLHCDKK